MKRNEQLKGIRPGILVDIERIPLSGETFQNEVLRPILKFQNDWILYYFSAKTSRLTIPADKEEQIHFLENILRKDAVIRNQLIGAIVGLFSLEELQIYLQSATDYNKRIVQMLVKRIQDQL